MDAILKADYGDKGQKAANDADRARAGARQAAAAGVRPNAVLHARNAKTPAFAPHSFAFGHVL